MNRTSIDDWVFFVDPDCLMSHHATVAVVSASLDDRPALYEPHFD
jgi:hypothetical protein